MLWGNLDPERNPERAYVVETRAGAGGVSGVVNAANLRKFVIDFKGGELDAFEADAPIDVLATAAGGIVVSSVLSRIDANGVWRLVLDIAAEDTAPLEIKAYLVNGGQALTESWLYQWRPAL
jgi:glucans biosynthesis protein